LPVCNTIFDNVVFATIVILILQVCLLTILAPGW